MKSNNVFELDEAVSVRTANRILSKLTILLIKEYTGFEMPREYWSLHHILPESIMYVLSYLLAAVTAAKLENVC
jgi:hypothetical protein